MPLGSVPCSSSESRIERAQRGKDESRSLLIVPDVRGGAEAAAQIVLRALKGEEATISGAKAGLASQSR